MNPDRLELIGITLVIFGVAAAVSGTWFLAGWPWALIVFAVLSIMAGIVTVRTAALTPEPETGKAGESE